MAHSAVTLGTVMCVATRKLPWVGSSVRSFGFTWKLSIYSASTFLRLFLRSYVSFFLCSSSAVPFYMHASNFYPTLNVPSLPYRILSVLPLLLYSIMRRDLFWSMHKFAFTFSLQKGNQEQEKVKRRKVNWRTGEQAHGQMDEWTTEWTDRSKEELFLKRNREGKKKKSIQQKE